jgi:hypothetical protein
MKKLLPLLFVPTLLFAQTIRFASPTGSPSGGGSRTHPWNITRAISACSNDTTIVLLDGIYYQDSTATWSMGRGVGRSRMIAEPGAHPLFTRNSGGLPRIYPAPNTTLQGIWFGGRGENDSTSHALGHGAVTVLASGDSIIACVWFNGWKGGIAIGGGHSVVIKNSLFLHCGMNTSTLDNTIYFSSTDPANASQAMVTYRNICLTSSPEKPYWPPSERPRWTAHGSSIQYWHNPRFSRILKNFTNYYAAHQGKDVVVRDNIFYQGNFDFLPMEGLPTPHDSTGSQLDTPHVWRRNIFVKPMQGITNVMQWRTPAYYGNTPAFPEVNKWDGDSTWMSQYFVEYGPWGPPDFESSRRVKRFGVEKLAHRFSTDTLSRLLGASLGEIDTAISRLTGATYNRTAQQVFLVRGTILSNWQTLLNVLDRWQGTIEERVDFAGDEISIPVTVNQGWNIIANPVTVFMDSVRQLFPSAASPFAFEYDSMEGYVPSYTLENGRGYSAQFAVATTVNLRGRPLIMDSVHVNAGWNLIGSLSIPIDTSTVSTVPPGLRASMYFGYEGGLTVAARIEPGRGYWVKSSAPGVFVLDTTGSQPAGRGASLLDAFSVLTIKDASGACQSLFMGDDKFRDLPLDMFEMPPAGPAGVFDARFASGRMAEVCRGLRAGPAVIELRNVLLPLTVNWTVPPGNDNLLLSDSSTSIGIVDGSGAFTFNGGHISKLWIRSSNEVIPMGYSLGQNFPNPFNASTNIKFQLPSSSTISLSVYDILGRSVARLVNGDYMGGSYSVRFNGDDIGSGTYFIRLDASPLPRGVGRSVSLTRKMLLLK